ncbi:MAG: DUF4197 domain-containing protein [Pseudomonadota bacterium]
MTEQSNLDESGVTRRRVVWSVCAAAALSAATGPASAQGWRDRLGGLLGGASKSGASALTETEAVNGLREALSLGAQRVVAQVGQPGGYLDDANIRIPLPGFLGDAQRVMGRVGASGMLDDLELRLNRGAEAAAPLAKDIFVGAVADMSVDDAIGIVRGPEDSATRYFQERMTPRLTSEFSPVMEGQLEQAGAVEAFDKVVARYDRIPLAPSLGSSAKSDLVSHGVGKGLDGVFFYLAKEEAAIRQDPAKRTTDILKRVFG